MVGGNLNPRMTEPERRRMSDFIEREFGIKMPAAKKSLLEGRLAKRLQVCGFTTFGGYFDFVTKDPNGQDEYLHFADLVSTHETSFFREPGHFDYLKGTVIPSWIHRNDGRTLSLLSAACSTGEEAYTLGMLVDSHLRQAHWDESRLEIEGVDLSDRAVGIARRGVYVEDRTRSIPAHLRTAYLMRSKDRHSDLCRFVPELRRRMRFHTGNLLSDMQLLGSHYDVIFCRNVLIYFEPANQRKVILSLLNRLKPEGLLFLGHSETMVSLDLPVRTVAHAVYQRA